MIELEPAGADRLRQAREALVQRCPIAEARETFGRALLDRVLERAHRVVADVRDEIQIHARHRVVQQEVADLVEHVTVFALPHEPDAKPMSSNTRDAVDGQLQARCDVGRSGPVVFRGFDRLEDAEPLQRDAGLKRNRCERELLRFRDGFEGSEVGRPIVSNHRVRQHTITTGPSGARTRPAYDANRS